MVSGHSTLDRPAGRWGLQLAAGGLVALCIVLLSACGATPFGGCADIGCSSQVSFVTGVEFTAGNSYEVEACAETFCRATGRPRAR